MKKVWKYGGELQHQHGCGFGEERRWLLTRRRKWRRTTITTEAAEDDDVKEATASEQLYILLKNIYIYL